MCPFDPNPHGSCRRRGPRRARWAPPSVATHLLISRRGACCSAAPGLRPAFAARGKCAPRRRHPSEVRIEARSRRRAPGRRRPRLRRDRASGVDDLVPGGGGNGDGRRFGALAEIDFLGRVGDFVRSFCRSRRRRSTSSSLAGIRGTSPARSRHAPGQAPRVDRRGRETWRRARRRGLPRVIPALLRRAPRTSFASNPRHRASVPIPDRSAESEARGQAACASDPTGDRKAAQIPDHLRNGRLAGS